MVGAAAPPPSIAGVNAFHGVWMTASSPLGAFLSSVTAQAEGPLRATAKRSPPRSTSPQHRHDAGRARRASSRAAHERRVPAQCGIRPLRHRRTLADAERGAVSARMSPRCDCSRRLPSASSARAVRLSTRSPSLAQIIPSDSTSAGRWMCPQSIPARKSAGSTPWQCAAARARCRSDRNTAHRRAGAARDVTQWSRAPAGSAGASSAGSSAGRPRSGRRCCR